MALFAISDNIIDQYCSENPSKEPYSVLNQFLEQIPTNGNNQEAAESDDEENNKATIIRQIKDFKLGYSLYKNIDLRLFISGFTKRYIYSLISSVASPNLFNKATSIT